MEWRDISECPKDTEVIATDGVNVFCGMFKSFWEKPQGIFHYLDQSKPYGMPVKWKHIYEVNA